MNKENLAGTVTAYNNLLDVLENNDSPIIDRTLDAESLVSIMERALKTLTGRECEIVKSFFGIGVQKMTFEEMGEKYGLPTERVQKMMEKAIRRLKHTGRKFV